MSLPGTLLVGFQLGNAAMLGDRTLKPKPGTCGTITYIAPETEVTKYSYLVNSYSSLIEMLGTACYGPARDLL